MSKRFAVFDIDGTLYRWQLFHELVEELAMSGVMPQKTYEHIDTAWNDWRGGSLHFHGYESLVVDTLLENLPSIPVETFESICDKIIAQSSHKLHAYPRRLLQDLKQQGYTIVAISGSQQELLDRFAAKHGIDIAIGALYERKEGRFTGEVERMTISRKHTILKDLVTEQGFTYDGSVAIGDSDGDIDILNLVEKPIAFNPSEGLFKHATSAGWDIVIERKNIAYIVRKQGATLVLAETVVY